MRKNLLALLLNLGVLLVNAQTGFVTTWKTDNAGISENNQITIPTFSGEVYNYAVDWGDGTSDSGITGDVMHTYSAPGIYEVSISGEFPRIRFGRSEMADEEKILEINQWGDIEWKSFAGAFNGCVNLDILATDLPNLQQVSSFEAAFAFCHSLKANETMDQWNMSNVEDLSYMFYQATSFNQNIGSWDLSNVSEINDMFHWASTFNQDIGNWRFPKVTSLDSMFQRATNFNGDISDWEVGNVRGMIDLFLHAYAFNQDISNWTVNNVEFMNDMFSNAKAFNQDISRWDVANVRSMSNMFANAISFDQNLGSWNIANVSSMIRMFNQVQLSTENYDGILTGWGALTNLQNNVVLDAGFSQYCDGALSKQNLIDNFGWQIDDSGISCPLPLSIREVRLVDAVQDRVLYSLREDAQISLQSLPNELFNFEVLATDDVGSVGIEVNDTQNLSSIANEAPYTLFGTNGTNDYLGGSLPTGTYTLIATPYSGDDLTGTMGEPYVLNFKVLDGVQRAFITTWKTDNPGSSSNNTISIRTIPGEYYYYDVDWGAGVISGGVSGNRSFTYQRPGTYTIKITGNFPGLVFDTNGDAPKLVSIDQWGDLDWESMEGAFSGCINMDVLATDVPDLSNVESMAGMFKDCSSLEGNNTISTWDTGTVTNMSSMFNGAKKFNQDISNWGVSNVLDMSSSFEGADLFNQNLGSWNVAQVTDMSNIFTLSGLSDTNYETILTSWAQLPSLQSGVQFGAQQNHYCDAADIRRNLITNHNWTILDGGLALNCAINGEMPFLTTWKTDNRGASANNQITIYTDTRWNGYDYTVDWGDGSISTNVQDDIIHTYEIPGVYRVAIYGEFPGMHINNGGDARLRDDDKILSIDQWGDNKWDFLGLAFAGCDNLDLKATDVPDFSKGPSLFGMFADCPSFNGNESMNLWDMASVDNTAYMFSNASSFNLSLDSWDMKNVLRINNMFQGASSFNQDLGIWDVSNVINMTEMLDGSGLSNKNYDKTLIGWAQLSSLQDGVQLDAPQNTYCEAQNARQNIIETYNWVINDSGKSCPFVTTWKTDNPGGSEDNQISIPTSPIESYNYNIDWGDGTTSKNVRGGITHTYAVAGTYQVAISGSFPRISFLGSSWLDDTPLDNKKLISIDQWGDIRWRSMEFAFLNCTEMDVFAQDTPNFSGVNNLNSMFNGCYSLVGNDFFNDWNVGNITTMQGLFADCFVFNQDLGTWDVQNARDMSFMFSSAYSFNQDIRNWNVSNVTDMRAMFQNAGAFDQKIGIWDVSKVTDMLNMFLGASIFNQNISSWDVGNVMNMNAMFSGALSFDHNIGNWNIANVTDFSDMFRDVSLSTRNYDALLDGWATQTLNNGVVFDGGNSTYCDGEAARQALLVNFGWIITDGGENPYCNLDNDTDGVLDHLDACLDTRNGVSVNTNGCEIIASDAILVHTETPTCTGVSNGSIKIETILEGYTFEIEISGQDFSDSYQNLSLNEPLRIENLAVGTYIITISIPDILYEQTYGATVNEVGSITGKRQLIDTKNGMANYLVSGSRTYEVDINGEKKSFTLNSTAPNQIQLTGLKEYNTIQISGKNDCQGKVMDSFVTNSEIFIYPVVTSGEVFVEGISDYSKIEVYDLSGRLMFEKSLDKEGQKSTIDFYGYSAGMYPIRITRKGTIKTFKIIKQ